MATGIGERGNPDDLSLPPQDSAGGQGWGEWSRDHTGGFHGLRARGLVLCNVIF